VNKRFDPLGCGSIQISRLKDSVTLKMPDTKFSLTDTVPLPNSQVRIPRLGFGVYQSSTWQCVTSCLTALKEGYRHIDTAQFYGNEEEVGEAVRQSGLSRADVFITTKILSAGGSVDKSYAKCLASVRKIDPREEGYVDLFLIHSPNAGSKARKEMWLALERLYEEGRAKSIGVSNFGTGHIEEMKGYAKVWPPHVNQIEVRLVDRISRWTLIQTPAASLVPTKSHRRLLPAKGDRGRSLLAPGAQL